MKRNIAISLFTLVLFMEIGIRLTGLYTTFSEDSTGEFWFEWAHERDSSIYAFPPVGDFDMDIGDTVFRYEINELGYRERPMPVDTVPVAQRIFVVGDSFTEGNGTEYHRSWTRRLEERVKITHPDAEFFVCGISGLDPHFAYAALKHQLLAFRPTHVITTVNDSDFDDQAVRGGYSRFRSDGSVKYLPAPWFLPVYRFSHITRMLVHEFFEYDHYLIRRNDHEVQQAEAADSISKALCDINALCIKNDVKFLAVIHPVPHKICFEADGFKSDILALNPHEFDFPVIRMYQPLKAAMTGPDCTTYHWKQDSHFNGKGYHLFGKLLYDEIQRGCPEFWMLSSDTVLPTDSLVL
jgi:hypothetical protein